MKALKLGSEARCIVTGFTGILTARVEYLNACIQYEIQPPADKDGKHPSGRYVDEGQVEVIGEGVSEQIVIRVASNDGKVRERVKVILTERSSGGPGSTPPQRPTP